MDRLTTLQCAHSLQNTRTYTSWLVQSVDNPLVKVRRSSIGLPSLHSRPETSAQPSQSDSRHLLTAWWSTQWPRQLSTKSPSSRSREPRCGLLLSTIGDPKQQFCYQSLASESHLGHVPSAPRLKRTQGAEINSDDGRHSRLMSPYTHESETSPFTTQSSRNVPSRTNPSFSRTRADAALRVSVSPWTRFKSSVSNAHCSKARPASVA